MNNTNTETSVRQSANRQSARPLSVGRHQQEQAAVTGKFHPATRTERMISWHQRMQLLFTRQNY